MKISKEVAECVGLWLAEGDNKTKYEINFSNNCWELVDHFHNTISNLFRNHKFSVRIYVYTANGEDVNIPFKNVKINRYIDKRARKPYFIYRIASVLLTKRWKELVNKAKKDERFYNNILRGFFAGEGNIKVGGHSSKVVRIAQGKRNEFIEDILNKLGVIHRFKSSNRSYEISGKKNWDRLAKIRIADLHPVRRAKFWIAYGGFKEEHYAKNYLINEVYAILIRSHSCRELGVKFNRSPARIYDVLEILKKEGKVINYRVKSKDYWIRNDRDSIIVSNIKRKYIDVLRDSEKSTKEFSNLFNVNWKAAFRRLKELEKLGIVKRDKYKKWKLIKTHKKVIYV